MNTTKRFEDSPELFGAGCGRATFGESVCGICGVVHNPGADDDEDGDSLSDEAIGETAFAGLNV